MGFEGAAIPAGEVREPGRHLPFALMCSDWRSSFSPTCSCQIVLHRHPPGPGHDPERPLADASLRFLGAPGAALISLGAPLSMGGTINALTFASPRILFAMAENGQLPGMFLKTHPGFSHAGRGHRRDVSRHTFGGAGPVPSSRR